jgi:hypothetical protein
MAPTPMPTALKGVTSLKAKMSVDDLSDLKGKKSLDQMRPQRAIEFQPRDH